MAKNIKQGKANPQARLKNQNKKSDKAATKSQYKAQKSKPTKPALELHPYLQKLKQAYKQNKLDMIYGLHAAAAVLRNPQREVEALVINPNAQGKVKELYGKLAQSAPHEFDLLEMERAYFDLLVGDDAVHQGIVIFAQPLEPWHLEDFYEQEQSLVMVLDQPSDPRNLGAILRNCAAFGVDGLIIPDRHSAESTPLIAKAAVGAMENVPIISVGNLKNALEKLKEHGFWLIGLDGHTDETIESIKPTAKTAVIMGSEGSGLRQLTQKSCDFLVKIPMEASIESLNLSVASGITLYEIRKKMNRS